MALPVWRLRKGMDRRFRTGHPWVYSNELQESPRGHTPGNLVELKDAAGQFLAVGYGNPASLIAFRALSRDPQAFSSEPTSSDTRSSEPFLSFLSSALDRAQHLREQCGFGDQVSYRLCYGEADYLPGLIIDRYRTLKGQAFVLQAHTAGAQQWLEPLIKILEARVIRTQGLAVWAKTSIVVRNDLNVRTLEGLQEEKPHIYKEAESLSPVSIQIRSVLDAAPLIFQVDLVHGQKTGFFLDQFANIQLAAWRFWGTSSKTSQASRVVRILDLCCYVGQWSAQLSQVLKQRGLSVEVLAVDASATALEFARQNITEQDAQCQTWKTDVLKSLSTLEDKSFDCVISDPPALIQSRKNIPVGSHAYLQLATQAVRVLKADGKLVACSCSALLDETSFLQILSKASARDHRQMAWVARGAPSPDHPMLAEFPEGRYLKGWLGQSR